MRVRVKICGVTTAAGAIAAARAGADAVGFVFADSPRRIEAGRAAELSRDLPPFVARVAVFHYPDAREVADVVRRLRPTVVQSEPVDGIREAIGGGVFWLPVLHDSPDVVSRAAAAKWTALLLEAGGRGGRGIAPDWERAADLAGRVQLVLAGGLDAENVAAAIRRVRPFAVDVSSSVESEPGVKDPERIRRFIEAVRSASDGSR